MITITPAERDLLNAMRQKADELAQLAKQAAEAGFMVNFNVNAIVGACDVFDVKKMMPVDLRSSAN